MCLYLSYALRTGLRDLKQLVGWKSFYQLCLFHWGVAVTGAASPEMETVLFYFNSKGIFTL